MASERAIPGTPEWSSLAPHHLARYLFAAPYAQAKRVLDAGTGAGYGAALLAQHGARELLAVDIDAAALAAARTAFPDPAVSFITADCESLGNIEGPFDLIVNFENIEHLDHPDRFLARAARLLAPDGLLLISTPDRANTPPFKKGRPENPHHRHEWYRDEFTALLTPHFAAIDMRVQVQSHALRAREQAVASLKSALMWSNPLALLLWRKIARSPAGERSWRALDMLAAPALVDYPIVPLAAVPIWGLPYCHLALCRHPITR